MIMLCFILYAVDPNSNQYTGFISLISAKLQMSPIARELSST